MFHRSQFIPAAQQLYRDYEMEGLPPARRRSSLHYYFLCCYPSLRVLRDVSDPTRPPLEYPQRVDMLYVHVPFCSGACEFCNFYFVVNPAGHAEPIRRYLELVQRELTFHARHTIFRIENLYFGGGTPSAIPPDALEALFDFLRGHGWLAPELFGTAELHPELFDDLPRAERLLTVFRKNGVNRVSIGFQSSNEDVLDETNRRHGASFVTQGPRWRGAAACSSTLT